MPDCFRTLDHAVLIVVIGRAGSLFAQLDRPALQPLPATRYEFDEWNVARVNLDYDVEVYRHFYSFPHALAHKSGRGACDRGHHRDSLTKPG